MSDKTDRRLARNEVLFRATNESIERGQWPGDPGKLVRFRCECSRLDCNEAVELTLPQYEQIRQSPRRFVVVAGHETPEIEMVVGSDEQFSVVEKRGAAGEMAAATDPRH